MGHSNKIPVNVHYKSCVGILLRYDRHFFFNSCEKCFFIVLSVTLPNSMHSKTEYTKTKAIILYHVQTIKLNFISILYRYKVFF